MSNTKLPLSLDNVLFVLRDLINDVQMAGATGTDHCFEFGKYADRIMALEPTVPETIAKHDCKPRAVAYAVWTGDDDQSKRQLIGNVYACGWCQKLVRDGRWKIDTVDEIVAKARFKAACVCTHEGECYGHINGDPCRVCSCDPNATVQSEDAPYRSGKNLHKCGDNPPEDCSGALSHATMVELESVHVPAIRAAFSRGRHIGYRDTRDKYEKIVEMQDGRVELWRTRAKTALGELEKRGIRLHESEDQVPHPEGCECGGFDRTASLNADEYVGYCAKPTVQAQGDAK